MQVMQGKTAAAVNDLHAGRHWRRRQAEGHRHRRYSRRQKCADFLFTGAHSRAFDYVRHRTENARG